MSRSVENLMPIGHGADTKLRTAARVWGPRRASRRVPPLVLLSSVLVAATPLLAQERGDRPAPGLRQQVHVIRPGDTLWDLARRYLRDPFLWREIYDANRDVVQNPHRVYPAERVRIPRGQPVVRQRVEGGSVGTAPAPAAASLGEARELVRTRFYAGPAARSSDAKRGAGPARPSKAGHGRAPMVRAESQEPARVITAGEFYAAPWLDEPSTMEVVGELVERVSPGAVRLELADVYVHPYDNVYLRYAGAARPAVGDRLLLVRVGRRVDRMGRIIQPTGIATVSALYDEVMMAAVTEQFGVMLPGTLAVPLGAAPEALLDPQPVQDGQEGTLIDFLVDQPLYATTDHAFVDLGRVSGLEVGDELVAFLPERQSAGAYDLRVPPEPLARLKVVRVAERSATVRVLQTEDERLQAGVPVRLVRKIP